MNRKQFRIWLAAFLFIAAVITASVLELARSYQTAFQVAFTEVDLSGYLVAEWVSESFSAIEYILKDALYDFNKANIRSASRSANENSIVNQRLLQKDIYHDDIIFLGIFDTACVIQYGSIDDIIGDSSAALNRSYCQEVMKKPIEKMKLSGFFISSTGAMNVSATYPLLGPHDEVVGFSLAALDLSFFQKWLDNIHNPAITISIMDLDQILLARKPTSQKVGQPVEDDRLTTFLRSGEESVSFRRASPVDDIDRLWSIRRTRNLPFVVAVGYALDDVLVSWRTKVASYVVGNLLVATVTLFLAMAYHKNRRTAEYMESLATTDPLTGLVNRRSFGWLVKGKLERALAANRPASFIMIDIDHFKAINDSLGHDAGDMVLKAIAEELKSSFRSSDVIGRWGGEEFLVYVADADLEAAKALAERLAKRVSERVFIQDRSVTVSQGVAVLEPDADFEAAIKRADEMLYRAKRDGRNCVRFT